MIVRAVERGVPAERIAEALDLDVGTIQRRFRMLNGICAEAVELLKDTTCPLIVFELLRQMAPIRQVEAAELMIRADNFSSMFAKALLIATPEKQLVDPRKRKPVGSTVVTSEQMGRMDRELTSLQTQVKSIEENYGVDNLHLTVAKGYVSKLLANAKNRSMAGSEPSRIPVRIPNHRRDRKYRDWKSSGRVMIMGTRTR